MHATDDDVAQLLAEPSVQDKAINKSSDKASEDEVLKELVAALQDEDKKRPKSPKTTGRHRYEVIGR